MRLCEKRGLPILRITHDLASARHLADTTAVAQTGRAMSSSWSIRPISS